MTEGLVDFQPLELQDTELERAEGAHEADAAGSPPRETSPAMTTQKRVVSDDDDEVTELDAQTAHQQSAFGGT